MPIIYLVIFPLLIAWYLYLGGDVAWASFCGLGWIYFVLYWLDRNRLVRLRWLFQ